MRFHLLNSETGSRLKQQYVDSGTGDIVPRKEMARGYEFAKGQYVILSDEEYKSLQEVASRHIELAEFVPMEKIDPIYFDKAYYVGPDKGGDRAYSLLAEAMRQTGLVGLARYAARGKQYLVLLRPRGDILVMQQLHYADEIKSAEEIGAPDAPEVEQRELDLAIKIIEQISTDKFAPEKFEDEVRARMLALIEQKIAGQEITAPPEAASEGVVIDLMEALKRSLGADAPDTGEKKRSARKPARAATKKKASAKKSKRTSG